MSDFAIVLEKNWFNLKIVIVNGNILIKLQFPHIFLAIARDFADFLDLTKLCSTEAHPVNNAWPALNFNWFFGTLVFKSHWPVRAKHRITLASIISCLCAYIFIIYRAVLV